MADFFAQVIAEFRALGAWCILHGPEAHLILPFLYGAVFFAVLFITRGGEKK